MPKIIVYPVAVAVIALGTAVSLLEALFLSPKKHTHFYGPYH